jgi:hypothetical protein
MFVMEGASHRAGCPASSREFITGSKNWGCVDQMLDNVQFRVSLPKVAVLGASTAGTAKALAWCDCIGCDQGAVTVAPIYG